MNTSKPRFNTANFIYKQEIDKIDSLLSTFLKFMENINDNNN